MLMVTFDTNKVVSDFFNGSGGNGINTGVNTGGAVQMKDIETSKHPQFENVTGRASGLELLAAIP